MEQDKTRKDLDYFLQMLEQNHPNPFLYITKSNFEQRLKEISKSSVDIPVLGLELQQLVSRIQDSHTQISLNKKILGNECYSIRFKSFADGIYLVKADFKDKKFLGMKLRNINNTSLEKVRELMKALIPKENSISYDYYFINFLHEPQILSYLNIIETPNEITYELEDEQGISHILSVIPNNIDIVLSDIKEKIGIFEDTLCMKEIYWTKYIENIRTYYFQYNSCKLREEFSIEKIIEEIKDRDIDKLVVDLRNNKGGDADILQPLVKYLDNPKRNFSLFVLTSSNTFSSAIINAIELSKTKNCLIIGDIPHGSPTHFGEVLHLTLPHSKLDYQLSTKLFEYPPYRLGETLKIDITIKETFEDYTSGIDKQMEYIRNVLP